MSILHLIVGLRIHTRRGMEHCWFLVGICLVRELAHSADFSGLVLVVKFAMSTKWNRVWGAYASGIHFEDIRKYTKGKM